MALQLDVDKVFHRRERRVQLVGSAIVVAILAAAVLGLAGGPGPLSTATAAEGPVAVAYERFLHAEADDSIRVTIAGSAVTGTQVDVELSAAWFAGVDVSGMAPEPAEQVHTGEGIVLGLPARPGARVTVLITFRTLSFGRLDGWVRAAGTRVEFRQFVYP